MGHAGDHQPRARDATKGPWGPCRRKDPSAFLGQRAAVDGKGFIICWRLESQST